MPDPTVEDLGKAFYEFKQRNEASLNASEARRKELEDQVKKYETRMDELETKLARPPLGAREPEEEMVLDLHRKQDAAFRRFCKYGSQVLTAEEEKTLLTRVITKPGGEKSLATDQLTTGGFLMPQNMSNMIAELLVEISPIRQLATVESLNGGDTWEGLKEGSTAFGTSWVSERGSRSETAAGTFELDKIPTHEQYANPFITEKQLDDSTFDVQSYAAKKIAQRFALAEGTAFVTGTGVGQPLGALSTLPGGTAVGTVSGGQSATIDTDDMLSLMAELKEEYARNASFLMRRTTKYVVRKLKDGNGQYLWQPNLQAGVPPTFDGRPVFEAPDVPAVASSAKSVIFADWKRFYTVVDRMGIRTRPDPFTNKPYVEIYTTRRVGGQVRLPEAGKILVCGA